MTYTNDWLRHYSSRSSIPSGFIASLLALFTFSEKNRLSLPNDQFMFCSAWVGQQNKKLPLSNTDESRYVLWLASVAV